MAEPTEEQLRDIYTQSKTIAVVGASTDSGKPGHRIPLYLQTQGYRIIPVNPRAEEPIFGEQPRASLDEVDESIDVVEVFRPADETPDIARAAAKAGAKVLWLQEGIRSDEARTIAEEAGLTVVMDRCMGVTHGQLGLGPGP